MKTIEERATKYADLARKQEFFDNRIKEVAANFAYSHYTIGATEQKAIDIEKACNLFTDCMNDAVKNGVLSSDFARNNIEQFREYLTEQ